MAPLSSSGGTWSNSLDKFGEAEMKKLTLKGVFFKSDQNQAKS